MFSSHPPAQAYPPISQCACISADTPSRLACRPAYAYDCRPASKSTRSTVHPPVRMSARHPIRRITYPTSQLLSRQLAFHFPSSFIRDELHWLPVLQRIHFKQCMLVYKSLHGMAPSCIGTRKPSLEAGIRPLHGRHFVRHLRIVIRLYQTFTTDVRCHYAQISEKNESILIND